MILGFDASTTLSSGRCSIFELLVAGDPGMEDDVDIVNSVANKLSALLQIVRYATVTIFYFKCVLSVPYCCVQCHDNKKTKQYPFYSQHGEIDFEAVVKLSDG